MDQSLNVRGKKILVTGGTGFLGRSLVSKLVREGAQVRVLDNDSRGSIASLGEFRSQVEFIAGDIRDGVAVSRAVQGMDSVCHLAFVNGTKYFYEKPELVLEVGVKGMMHVLDACREHRVRDLFLMSSSEVYQVPPVVPTPETVPGVVPDVQNPRYSYGGGKLISELLAINYGRVFFDRVIIVRPHNAYGPQMGFEHVIPEFSMRIKKMIEQDPGKRSYPFKIQGSGLETRSFVFVDDFTDGLFAAYTRGEHLGIYHVGTEEERSIRDVAHAVAKEFGVTITIEPGALTQGSTPRRCPAIAKVRALGYEPKVSFEEGVRRTVSWYREQTQ
jgi:nucleoside-diphosphate-sugar epimerase